MTRLKIKAMAAFALNLTLCFVGLFVHSFKEVLLILYSVVHRHTYLYREDQSRPVGLK